MAVSLILWNLIQTVSPSEFRRRGKIVFSAEWGMRSYRGCGGRGLMWLGEFERSYMGWKVKVRRYRERAVR